MTIDWVQRDAKQVGRTIIAAQHWDRDLHITGSCRRCGSQFLSQYTRVAEVTVSSGYVVVVCEACAEALRVALGSCQ